MRVGRVQPLVLHVGLGLAFGVGVAAGEELSVAGVAAGIGCVAGVAGVASGIGCVAGVAGVAGGENSVTYTSSTVTTAVRIRPSLDDALRCSDVRQGPSAAYARTGATFTILKYWLFLNSISVVGTCRNRTMDSRTPGLLVSARGTGRGLCVCGENLDSGTPGLSA